MLDENIKYLLKNKLFWQLIIVLGLAAKLLFFNVATVDYEIFLLPWINFIKSNGYFEALQFNFYDYTPLYIYVLIFIAKLNISSLYAIKIVSIFFEFLIAYFIGKIAFLKYKNTLVFWIFFAIIPLLPSVFLNSVYLVQCDSIFTAFLVASIYFILKEKKLTSLIMLGIAFSLKLQTIFILPFYFALLLRKKIEWYYFLIVPLTYFISIIPAWFFGRPLHELLSIYASQSGNYHFLTMNFPNIYIFLNNEYYQILKIVGVLITFLVVLYSGIYMAKKQFELTYETWINLAFLSVLIVPFLLPGMHERYLYPADVLSVLYFIIFRKKIYFPVSVLLISLYSYIRCSRFNDILPTQPAFVLYLIIIILAIIDFKQTLNKRNETTK